MLEPLDVLQVDPEHYEVIFENRSVRALRTRFAPGARSRMHSHPPSTLVFQTHGQVRFHAPDGSHNDFSFHAGQVLWVAATTHLPENIGSKPFELIQIEIKEDGL